MFISGFRQLIRKALPDDGWVADLVFGAGLIHASVVLMGDVLAGGAALHTFNNPVPTALFDTSKAPELRPGTSEPVLWSGKAGLFNNDILIVTTRRVIFKHGSAWTRLGLSDIDTVDVLHNQLLVATRGITHRVDFRKKQTADDVARIIFQNMLRQ